ncbi:MAG: transposase [Patescibacteria group bacterium]
MTLEKIYLPEQYYFITTNILNKEWVFGKLIHGIYEPNERLCVAFIKALNELRKIMGFLLSGYVIMPNHVHLILKTAENESFDTAEDKSSATRFNDVGIPTRVGENSFSPGHNISQIMKAIKGRSARIINEILGKNGQLWQHSFYEHGIRNEQDFIEKLNYIHFNPVRAGLVEDQSDFKYSSYQNYHLDDDLIIKIDKIDL